MAVPVSGCSACTGLSLTPPPPPWAAPEQSALLRLLCGAGSAADDAALLLCLLPPPSLLSLPDPGGVLAAVVGLPWVAQQPCLASLEALCGDWDGSATVKIAVAVQEASATGRAAEPSLPSEGNDTGASIMAGLHRYTCMQSTETPAAGCSGLWEGCHSPCRQGYSVVLGTMERL